MPTVVVELRNNQFDRIARELPEVAQRLALQTAMAIETKVKVGMAEPKSGIAYERGSGTHVASAPGEMPAIDTGALVNSIQSDKDGRTGAVVYSAMEYAVHLEYGTVRMAARPFFTPAAEEARPEFEAECARLERLL